MKYIHIPSDNESVKESTMVDMAAKYNMDEELISYAKHIQKTMSESNYIIPWIDALEMSFNELIIPLI